MSDPAASSIPLAGLEASAVVVHPSESHLPLAEDQRPSAPEIAPSHADFPSYPILIVDDNVDAGDIMAMLLRADGHIVTLARDGGSALEAAETARPKVVLLDIGLPDLDGYEVARRLREKFPDIQLIAVSGWGRERDRQLSREAGFNQHLVKPTTIEQIREAIAHA